jgi:hypothetical protein
VQLRAQVARGDVARIVVGLVQHGVLADAQARVARLQRLHNLAHCRRGRCGVAVRVPAAVEAEHDDVQARELLLVERVVVVLGADVHAHEAREVLRLRGAGREREAREERPYPP